MKTALLTSLLLSLLLVPAAAQPGFGGGRGFGGPGHGDDDDRPVGRGARHDRQELLERLKLTDAQRSAFDDIRTSTQKEMIDIRAAMAKKRLDMRTLMAQDAPGRGAVEKLSREILDLQLRQRMTLFDADQNIQKLLTDEQRPLWKEHRQRMLGRMAERMSGKGGRGGRR